ncbi:Holliday junction branch migration DNA helicase RuvB [Rickettsiales endosymbiont of Trichoplax sp. H2]|uniref:Holliday junction branch migration DNA helicase RuvB n=1 Tax=Rickettsiales endosymbiont of Trichoplax sp. H2 TaxID=2021221 RepID=UPI0012B26053|nr:Holliday junction branch migration DNA helicase RuvB [Rickettsiales endosymbiont of Trichoplax sp. H2]MSO13397.1 Holliday junction ATP-dependent DNA helicase RuvB [Rickettsiales endosymbiont of Trichoplax sp. H2]
MDIKGSEIIRDKITKEDLNEVGIRPGKLEEFIGQKKIVENLKVFIGAAKFRSESLDHVLFHGPPGLGKTTLAQIIAKEVNSNIKITSGPMLSKTRDLAAVLTNLEENDILFIDEIHRMTSSVEEVLYPAMEDFYIDLIIGDGPAAKTVKINIPKFTLVGATTRLGLLTNPLRDRFGITFKLDFYCNSELEKVVSRAATIFKVEISQEAAEEISRCSRGTPRIAVKLLKRVRDYANYNKNHFIDMELVRDSLKQLHIDSIGLDNLDYKYINFIINNYNGGPVGIDTISAGLSEERDTIEDTIEPYLLQLGFINRTPRGRVITSACLNHMGMKITNNDLELNLK